MAKNKRAVFLCPHGLGQSPIAASHFRSYLRARGITNIEVISMPILGSRSSRPISADIETIKESDIVFVQPRTLSTLEQEGTGERIGSKIRNAIKGKIFTINFTGVPGGNENID